MGTFTYIYGGITDRGDVRVENQDSILFLPLKEETTSAGLFVVADGMGGLSFGAEVSRFITQQFERWWNQDFPDMIRTGMEREEDIRELIEQEIWDINQAVYHFNISRQCRSGSTLSLLLLYGNRYFIENMGDSRIYLLHRGKLRQLTCDQSVRTQMKNKLTMCVGMFPVPQSDYDTGKLRRGDRFLICSDGCYNPLDMGKIQEVLEDRESTAYEKALLLRQMIRQGEALDNVSAIVAEVH